MSSGQRGRSKAGGDYSRYAITQSCGGLGEKMGASVRLGILLAREGLEVNHKKLFRLYREEGLAVRRRRSRKRALGTRWPILVPDPISV